MDNDVFQEKLGYQLLDSFVKQTPIVISGHVIVASINIVLFWGAISNAFVLGWASFLVFIGLSRWVMKIQYQRHWRRRSPGFWRGLFAVSSMSLGVIWCVWSLYVGSAIGFDGVGLSILVITVAGLASGAVASTSSSLVSYGLFAAPILLPMSVWLLLLDQTEVRGIGVLMVVFFIITLRQVLRINSVLKQSITNGLELEESKEQTELLAKELYKQSTIDVLTSVTNRRGFNESLSSEWQRAKRSRMPLTLLMIDVDCFKPFNDNLGHPAGDECLQRIAAALRSVVKRAGETIARYGGEEFAVLLPNTTPQEGVEVAEKIRTGVFDLNIAHPASDVADWVTVSTGVHCVYPGEDEDSQMLIELADQALYEAKAAGRNCVRQA